MVEVSTGVAGAYCGKVLRQLGADVQRHFGLTTVNGSAAAQEQVQRTLHFGKSEISGPLFEFALSRAQVIVMDALVPGDRLEHVKAHILARVALDHKHAVVLMLSHESIADDRSGCSSELTATAGAALNCAIGSRNEEPLGLPYDVAGYMTGASGAAAAVAGLLGGSRPTGRLIEVATRDVMANVVGTVAKNFESYGRPWLRDGTRPSMSGGVYPCGLFPCRDGYVAVYCRGSHEWLGLIRAMGEPPWSRELRFQDPKIVAALHADEADGHLMAWLRRYSRAELMQLGREFGFPAAPVNYVRETLQNPQFIARQSFISLPATATGAGIAMVERPWRLRHPDGRSASSPARMIRTGPVEADPSSLLKGVRVLDFSWVWSGPMVTSFLTDLGAEVIKVEHASRPDSVRTRGAALVDGRRLVGPVGELNPWFNQLNHGKKSISVDIKSSAGRLQLLELAADCDIVVENMRPGAMAEAGLGFEELSSCNDGLVMLSMSMVGQTGPLASLKGYAGLMSAMSGLESVTGYESTDPDAAFVGMTTPALGDPNGATHALAVLFAALHQRRQTGQGVWIDLSQTDAVLSLMAAPLAEAQLGGNVPVLGNVRPGFVPHGHFRCIGEDQWIAISVATDEQWRTLALTVGAALEGSIDWNLSKRHARRAVIDLALQSWTAKLTVDQAVGLLRSRGVSSGVVASYGQMVGAAWLKQRGLIREVEHPYIGKQDVFVPPWRFDQQTGGASTTSAPLLGEHSASYLRVAAAVETHDAR
ncbi:CoA transferase [soil metagenome]